MLQSAEPPADFGTISDVAWIPQRNVMMIRHCWHNLLVALIASSALGHGLAFAQDGQAEESYLIKPGDELNISVWGEEDLERDVLIRPDGGFSFPLAGDLNGAGKSVEAIRVELSERLARYIPNLVATVMVTAINGNKIYVIGQVNTPGSFVMNPRLDVMQALSVAGGTTPFAQLADIRILRRTARGQVVLPFSFSDIAKGKGLEQNVVLESGDVVVVP